MAQSNKSINNHIENYLDYYCGLSHAPRFAVLLKGQWGAGKTWFINKYLEKPKHKGTNHKFLYVSLNGMTTFSDIENAFFQQLHPVLSSKGMAIAGKIFKGLLKTTLKIDVDGDSKDDGTLSSQIPDINLPEYLKNADERILIFDDLERCKIDIGNILGYINYFVEHQDLKVVILANEDELLKRSNNDPSNNYHLIKEKLIGKTLEVSPDFQGALSSFISNLSDQSVKDFLGDQTELMQELYKQAEYENLRILGQIVLDYERIFKVLPQKAQNKPELLQDILKPLMAFSIEIKRGTMLPKDISKLQKEYASAFVKQGRLNQAHPSGMNNNTEEQTSLQKILGRYTILNLYDPFPSTIWWQIFFDKGSLDEHELEKSISNSKYFPDKNTPDWVRLWRFPDLSDDEFEYLLKKVELEYSNRDFSELGVIKHVTGLLLMFADVGLYCKSKEDILNDSKLYLDHLKDNDKFRRLPRSKVQDLLSGYDGLDFQGRELTEFKEFSSYIAEIRGLVIAENMPSAAQELLITMQGDLQKFFSLIRLSVCHGDVSDQGYYEVPILKHIEPGAFIEKLLLMKFEDQRRIFWALSDRYKSDHINKKLIEELEWLKSVEGLLLEESNRKKGKVSGYCSKFLIGPYLTEVIEKLEKIKTATQN